MAVVQAIVRPARVSHTAPSRSAPEKHGRQEKPPALLRSPQAVLQCRFSHLTSLTEDEQTIRLYKELKSHTFICLVCWTLLL